MARLRLPFIDTPASNTCIARKSRDINTAPAGDKRVKQEKALRKHYCRVRINESTCYKQMCSVQQADGGKCKCDTNQWRMLNPGDACWLSHKGVGLCAPLSWHLRISHRILFLWDKNQLSEITAISS